MNAALIHEDIKPGAIIANRASAEIRLTGFRIATRLARERQAKRNRKDPI
jgi:hypothetical protein